MTAGQAPGTRAAQSAATRTALLEAAKRVFAAQGYLNTKITDVTAAARRSAGSFYSHFASKEELLEALLEEVGAAGDDQAASAGHRSDFRDPEVIRWHAATYWRIWHEHAATMTALGEAALVSPDFAARLEEFRRAQLAELAGHLSHVENLPASTELTLAMMTSVMEGITRLYPHLPAEEAVEAMTHFIHRALTP